MMEFLNGYMDAFTSAPGTMTIESIKIIVLVLIFALVFIKLFDR